MHARTGRAASARRWALCLFVLWLIGLQPLLAGHGHAGEHAHGDTDHEVAQACGLCWFKATHSDETSPPPAGAALAAPGWLPRDAAAPAGVLRASQAPWALAGARGPPATASTRTP